MAKIISVQHISLLIKELLLLHDCVIIPELGAFVGYNESASLHPVTQRIQAPSKRIIFNKHIVKDDGLLNSFLMNNQGILYYEAKKSISDFVSSLKSELQSNGQFLIPHVGNFKMDVENSIVFKQQANQNFSVYAYGLSPVSIQPVLRPVSVSNELEEKKIVPLFPVIEKANVVNDGRRKSYIRYIIPPTIAASVFFMLQTFFPSSVHHNMTEFSLLNANKSYSSMKVEDVKRINIYKSRKSPAPQSTVNFMFETATFYPIAGSFASLENANLLIEELSDMGFNALLVDKTHAGLYRVGYGEFSSFKAANRELEAIRKSINNEAWLLVK